MLYVIADRDGERTCIDLPRLTCYIVEGEGSGIESDGHVFSLAGHKLDTFKPFEFVSRAVDRSVIFSYVDLGNLCSSTGTRILYIEAYRHVGISRGKVRNH